MPEVVQVNLSRGGIPKRAVAQAMITTLGLAGDRWAHPQLHGGPDQRVLLLAAEVVDELASEGFPVFYGALGENLTVRGVDPSMFRPGQMWRAGNAILQLTKEREPCATLHVYGRAIRHRIKGARAGYYASVRRQGLVSPGAPFELLSDEA